MKKTYVLPAILLLIATTALAQGDTIKNLSIKKPSQAISEDSPGSHLRKDLIRINSAHLPAPLQETLSSDSTYTGWERSKFYYDPALEIYLMETREGITTRIFRFDKNGKAVSGNIPEQ